MSGLGDLARLFLKLGVIGFGGPAAHIALMREEVVERRKWLNDQQFVDLVGVTGLIPGPSSTEMAIHVGRERAGWRGLVVSGACFIIPAATMVAVLAWLYTRFGATPRAALFLSGLEPVVLAVVADAIWKLGRSAVTTITLGLIAMCAFMAVVLGVEPVIVFMLGGALVMALRAEANRVGAVVPAIPLLAASDLSSLGLFGVFVRIGFSVFGSGYVLLAYLQDLLVDDLALLTKTEVLDAVAIGQITPGPVFTTATFLGFVIDGIPGAMLATAGIFLPSFLLVALIGPLIPRLRERPAVAAFVDGINAVAIGVMATVLVDFGAAVREDALGIAFAIAATVAIVLLKRSPTQVLLVGAAIGVVRALLG